MRQRLLRQLLMSDSLVANVRKQGDKVSFDFSPNSDSFRLISVAGANFQCPANQNHILCQCCLGPMPDQRDEADIHQHCK